MKLVLFSNAKKALAECHRVDEVKDIRDKAVAMQAYARIAEDTELMRYSTEIRIRAERRAGELIKEFGERRGGQTHRRGSLPSNRKLGITDNQSSRWQKLATIPEPEFEERIVMAHVAAVHKSDEAMQPSAKKHGTQGTGENEWYTPSKYIESARSVMGSIDLDPATSSIAQETVKARNFLTYKDDGLKHDWIGNVWLNPPYSRDEIGPFVSKMVKEFAAGLMLQGIMLTSSYTDTEWFHLAMSAASAICFTRGRIKFLTPEGIEADAPIHGHSFFYFGTCANRFADEFIQYGGVMAPWQASSAQMAMSRDGTFMSKDLQPNIGL